MASLSSSKEAVGFAPPMIYNLFPRLAGPMTQWPEHAKRMASMGFNWVYFNPLNYPGFSGSLYSIKDYQRINPAFLPKGEDQDPWSLIQDTFRQFKAQNIKVMVDLVINHTSIDSPLIQEHPTWYCRDSKGEIVRPSAIDPADDTKITVWGDLAEVDNENSPDKEALWEYWRTHMEQWIGLGVDGFRCDAAYKVPADLWTYLIGAARKIHPQCRFFAETLGCRLDEVRAVSSAGFDYLFNSSKWWNFDAPWALEQHESHRHISPSVAFPESHDTSRLAADTSGLDQVQRQRYAFAAAFSEGIMIPAGYEFGFKRRLDVVHSSPADWENQSMDLTGFIRRVNALKTQRLVLADEGVLDPLGSMDRPILALGKVSQDGSDQMVVLINKDWHSEQAMDLGSLGLEGLFGGRELVLQRVCADNGAGADGEAVSVKGTVLLGPAEVAYLFGC